MPDLDALAQLVFFVLIVAGWVIKAVVEARQAKQRKQAPPPVETEIEGVPEDRDVRPRPRPVPLPTPAGRRPRHMGSSERLGHLDVPFADHHLAAAGGRKTPGRLLQSSAAAIAQGESKRRARRASVLSRISGGANVAPGPELTRAGVLWSEILGPCRALRGPHRSPAATRRSGS